MILSDKSSGSSALQKELLKHPAVQCIATTRHNQKETLYWNKAAAMAGLPAVNVNYSVLPISRERARTELIELLRQNVPTFNPPREEDQLVFEGWRALCEQFGPVFVEKSPHHLHDRSALAMILRAVNTLNDIEFCFIGLTRDPMDTLYSMWRRWRAVPELSESDWHRAYSNLVWFRSQEKANTITIRYEDLVEDPAEVMKVVCEFLSLDWVPGLGDNLHRRSVHKWTEDPFFGFQVSEEVGKLGTDLGYQKEKLCVAKRLLWPPYREMSSAMYPIRRRCRRLCRSAMSAMRLRKQRYSGT